jgi:hypothetical protein
LFPPIGYNAGMEKASQQQLSADDHDKVRAALEAIPGIDHRIVCIIADDTRRVRVLTGEHLGPRGGKGDVLEAKQSDSGEWTLTRTDGWDS